MRNFKAFAVLAVFSWACIDLPEVEQVVERPDAGEPGPGRPDASVGDSGTPDAGHAELVLGLVTPRPVTYTNGSVQLGVEVEGGPPEKVELLVDGNSIATLTPPYVSTWDTTTVAEGEHLVRARGTLSGVTYLSPESVILVDRTAPQVLSRVPSPGAEGISVRDAIQATFDEPLDAATLTGTSTQLRVGSTGVPHTARLSEDGRTMTVFPSASLGTPSTVTLALTTELRDLAGNPLRLPEEAWAWNLPESFILGAALRANAGARNAISAVIQQDVNANLVLAWSEEDGTSRNVYVRRRKNGVWEPLGGALSAYAGNTPASGPALELDGQGNPMVAWVEGNGGISASISVRRWNGEEWKTLADGVTGPSSNAVAFATPSLRLDNQGGAFMAWSESKVTYHKVFVQRWSGTGWFPVGEDLPVESKWPTTPSLDLDSHGNPVIAFLEHLDGVRKLHVRWRQGGTWSSVGAPLEFPSEKLGIEAPLVRMDRDDHPVVTWLQSGVNPNVVASIQVRRWDGSKWQPLGDALSAHPGGTAVQAHDLQIDAQGRPTLTWNEYDGSGLMDVYVQHWDGMDWKPVGGAVSALPGNTSAAYPSLSLDSYGVPTIAWMEHDGTASAIHVLQYNR